MHMDLVAQGERGLGSYSASKQQQKAVAALQTAIASGFAPAVATLYGTMQAFTISLLTERIRRIQVSQLSQLSQRNKILRDRVAPS